MSVDEREPHLFSAGGKAARRLSPGSGRTSGGDTPDKNVRKKPGGRQVAGTVRL